MRTESYSSISTYENCPKQYQLTYVTKVIPFQETEATRWGNEVHLALENYCLKGDPLGDKFKSFQPYADRILALPGEKFFEREFAITSELKVTTFDDKNAILRGIIDVGVIHGHRALVNDWKTGKVKEDSDQLMLFALFVFVTYPLVETVKTVYTWLAHKKTTVETFHRSQLPEIVNHFLVKINRIKASWTNDRWIPRTSGLCNGWCGANSHCVFWRPKRTYK